jgi:hypothetical protein
MKTIIIAVGDQLLRSFVHSPCCAVSPNGNDAREPLTD